MNNAGSAIPMAHEQGSSGDGEKTAVGRIRSAFVAGMDPGDLPEETAIVFNMMIVIGGETRTALGGVHIPGLGEIFIVEGHAGDGAYDVFLGGEMFFNILIGTFMDDGVSYHEDTLGGFCSTNQWIGLFLLQA